MNTKHYTSISQSKKLLELGMNPETADMLYTSLDGHTIPWIWTSKPGIHPRDIPCWSLGALLEVMPKETEWPFEDSNAFVGYGDGCYRCVYLSGNWESSHQEVGNSYIEAAFNMVVWLLENEFIKNEPKTSSE